MRRVLPLLLSILASTLAVTSNSAAQPSAPAEVPTPGPGSEVPVDTPETEPEVPVDTPETEPEVALGPSLPQPEFIPAAPYPPEALESGTGAEVLLKLTLSEEGRVVDVEVEETGGAAFDKAALQIAPSFVFSPAIDKKGQPQPAQILYRYVFSVQTAPVVNVEGQLQIAGLRQPVPDAQLQVQRDGFPSITAESDADGVFRFADLAPGTWKLIATKRGFQPEIAEIEIREGAVTQVTLYPVKDRPWLDSDVNETIEVVGERVAPEITERVLSADDIRYLPGTNGDVVRAIQNLPGIARPPLNIGQLIIRGTSPEDSRYYLDGMKIPIVFHFSGLSTVINGDSISEVAFIPGNYGARYGRSLGGVVDIRVKSELPERSNGYVSIDLFQTTAFVEQRVGKNTAVTVSGRRSYFDAILNPILNGMGSIRVQAPRYYDFQTRVLHKSPRLGSIDLFFLASDDRFRFLGPAEVDENGEEVRSVAAGLTTAFQKFRLLWTRELKGGWRSETSFILGPERQTFEFGGTGEAYEKNFGAAFRQEMYRGVPEDSWIGWRFGLDLLGGQERYLYDVPVGQTQPDQEPQPPEQGESWTFAPAGYVEPTLRFGSVDLIPGVRFDGWMLEQGIVAYSLDPRLGFKWNAHPNTVLKASVGKFSQFPSVRQALDSNKKGDTLSPQFSIQSSLGIEQRIIPELSVEANIFYNHLTQLVVGREDAFRFYSGPPPVGPFDVDPYANEGIGRVCGLELLAKLQTSRAVAILSATFGNSSRVDRKGNDSELFRYDQPFVVNALGTYKLPKRWRIGARVRVSAGNPYTPVSNRIYDMDKRIFLPVYGERDSARLPPFWSIDLRFDKDYVFRKWTLTTYLDLQNAANTRNVEVMGWTYDYGEEDVVTSNPLTPAFGLRGEW